MVDADEASPGHAPTQEVHDVVTGDGTVPAEFRALARKHVSVYASFSMMNGTVAFIVAENNNNTYFTTTDANGKQYPSKKVNFGYWYEIYTLYYSRSRCWMGQRDLLYVSAIRKSAP